MMASQKSHVGFGWIRTKFRPYKGLWVCSFALGAFIALSFVLSACAPSSPNPQPPARAPQVDGVIVNVAARISGFKLDRTSVEAGVVTFIVKNDDFMPHDFAIQGNGVQEKTPQIAPTQSASLIVDLKPGTYTYVCTIPGHSQTMHGTLTVN